MRELLVVLQREFVERVRSKSFILSTILTPLLLLLVGLGPMLFSEMRRGGEFVFALVDETGGTLGEQTRTILSAPPEGDRDDVYQISVIRAPLASVRDSLVRLIEGEAIDGYIHFPADLQERGEVLVRTEDALAGAIRRRIAAAASTAVQSERLRRTGLTPAELGSILRPVELDAAQLTVQGEQEQSEAGMIFAFLSAFFLYMLTLLYGTQVMQSVQEEKTNRISEVLVSSIRAQYLMLGKVLGVGLVALLQVSIWAAFAAALMTQRERLAGFGLPQDALAPLLYGAEAGAIWSVLLFLVLGFFLYATLFAAVGAIAESTEDAQRFTFPIIMPLIIPIMMMDTVISAPRDTAAVVLSWIPFTAPLVMPMRLGVNGATPLEVAAAVVFLVLSVLALGWLTGKIYRVGILSTGKRATWADVVKWVRMA